jgi:hypothetical protein
MHNTAATGDKGRVPVLVEIIETMTSSLVESDDSGGWILRQTESYSEATSI